MIVIGVVLVVLGLVYLTPVVAVAGVAFLAIGAVFSLLGAEGHAIGGRRIWY